MASWAIPIHFRQVYRFFASHGIGFSKCPIKNQIMKLTFAFGLSSGSDSRCLRFFFVPDSLGHSKCGWSEYSCRPGGVRKQLSVGEFSHSISLASLSVPSSRHASPSGLDISIWYVSCLLELEFRVSSDIFVPKLLGLPNERFLNVHVVAHIEYIPFERTHNSSNGVIG